MQIDPEALVVLVTLWADPYRMEGRQMDATICEIVLRQLPETRDPVSECMPMNWWLEQQAKNR